MIQVLSLTVFALLLARVMRAPRGTWRYIVGAAALVLAASQLLPPGNAFRADVADSASGLLLLGLALAPVAGYALLVRSIRRRTLADERPAAPGHPVGLVLIAEDGALARDTEQALEAETGEATERLSVGWRDPAGALVGHARLRLRRGLADLELLWVAEEARGQGIGRRLIDGAAAEARRRGASGLVASVPEAAGGFLQRNGFVRYAALGAGRLLHLHRPLP
jgi:GNAT superfamily N-acetyltransferase